jgi:hypothetical protein
VRAAGDSARRARAAALAAAGWVAALRAAAQETGDIPRELPPGPEVMAGVRAALPPEPWMIRAELVNLDEDGEETGRRLAGLRTDFGAAAPEMAVILADAFGTERCRMVLRRPAAGPVEREYSTGDPPARAEPPPGAANVDGTEFSWDDLALSFLWWPGGVTRDAYVKKGRPCYVVDLEAPDAGSAYARVRLWIDTTANAMLQAEGFDAGGGRVKRLAVKSLKKVGERWMLEDLEVQSFPSGRRTVLRVLDSRVAAEPQAAGP